MTTTTKRLSKKTQSTEILRWKKGRGHRGERGREGETEEREGGGETDERKRGQKMKQQTDRGYKGLFSQAFLPANTLTKILPIPRALAHTIKQKKR